jgi:hypothetical protein
MDPFTRGCATLQEGKRMQESRGDSNDGMRKRQQPGDHSIFIDASPQRVDLTIAVTPSVNAPPNGPLPLSDRMLQIQPTELCRNGSLLKRRTQRARKRTTTTLPSTARQVGVRRHKNLEEA